MGEGDIAPGKNRFYAGPLQLVPARRPVGACGDGSPGGQIAVQPANQMPVAISGPMQTATIGATLTLEASASHDPDGETPRFGSRGGSAPRRTMPAPA